MTTPERKGDRSGKGRLPLQIGALPWRRRGREIEVLLVQSLSTRRWIIPKGWPDRERELWKTARQEAFEEAGVLGQIEHAAIGDFKHEKTLAGVSVLKCRVMVYPLEVDELLEDWPEQSVRSRRWFTIEAAGKAVQAKGLGRLLRAFARRHALSA